MPKWLHSKSVPYPIGRSRNHTDRSSRRYSNPLSIALQHCEDRRTSSPRLDRLPLRHRTYLCCRKEQWSGNRAANHTYHLQFYRPPKFADTLPSTYRDSDRDTAEGSIAHRGSGSPDREVHPSRRRLVEYPPRAESLTSSNRNPNPKLPPSPRCSVSPDESQLRFDSRLLAPQDRPTSSC